MQTPWIYPTHFPIYPKMISPNSVDHSRENDSLGPGGRISISDEDTVEQKDVELQRTCNAVQQLQVSHSNNL